MFREGHSNHYIGVCPMMFLNSQQVEFRPWVSRLLSLFVRPLAQPPSSLQNLGYSFALPSNPERLLIP